MIKILKEVKARLIQIGEKLSAMARRDELSEVFLIKFDRELIRAIDAIEILEVLAKKNNVEK